MTGCSPAPRAAGQGRDGAGTMAWPPPARGPGPLLPGDRAFPWLPQWGPGVSGPGCGCSAGKVQHGCAGAAAGVGRQLLGVLGKGTGVGNCFGLVLLWGVSERGANFSYTRW